MRCASWSLTDQERQAGRRCDRQRRRPGDVPVLRYYLIERNALPDRPLIAMVPVVLRSKEDADAGGNLVGNLCNLATRIDDPAQRVRGIQTTSQPYRQNECSPSTLLQVLALSALNMAPPTLAGVPGFLSAVPPPFNIVISNVPGPVDLVSIRHGPA